MIRNLKKLIPILVILIVVIVLLLISNNIKLNGNQSDPNYDEDMKLADLQIYYNSSRVAYDNSNSGMSSNTIQDAIDELYASLSDGCYVGYTKSELSSTQYTCNKRAASSSQTDFIGLNVKYDNLSGLNANNIQSAIDELIGYVNWCNDGYEKDNITSNGYDCVKHLQPGYISLGSTWGNVRCNSSKTISVASHHGGSLSCTTSNSSVATCSVSGTTVTVTGGAASESTIITITSAATDSYSAASATYELSVLCGWNFYNSGSIITCINECETDCNDNYVGSAQWSCSQSGLYPPDDPYVRQGGYCWCNWI